MASSVLCIGVGAQTFFARKNMLKKTNKMPEFFVVISRKIIQIAQVLSKKARILHNDCPENIFTNFWGTCPPCPRLLRLWYFDILLSYMHVSILGLYV